MWILLTVSLLASAEPPPSLDTAEVAMRSGRFEEALRAGQALLAPGNLSADDVLRAKRVLGVAEIGLADSGAPDAEATLREAITQLAPYHAAHPNELFVQAKLGEAYLRTGAVEQGLALVDPLIAESAIPDVHVWEAMARAKQEKGDTPGARVSAKACLRLDPDDAPCKSVLASVGAGARRRK